MLAFLSSMQFEFDLIMSGLKNVRMTETAGKTVCKGRFSGRDVLLVSTGIGKVNAAHAVTVAAEKFSVEKVINLGVGGAYPGAGLEAGDVAVAVKEIYGDEGVVDADGWGSYKKIGIPLVQDGDRKYFNEFPVAAIHELPLRTDRNHFRVRSGNFVTVSAATGTDNRARELEKRFKAVCENMEGAAIAHVSALYKIPFAEVRGISNIVGVRDKRKWNMPLAAENCQKFIIEKLLCE